MGASSAETIHRVLAVGVNGGGAMTATGAVVGRPILDAHAVVTTTNAPNAIAAGALEKTVSVTNQVQQVSTANLSNLTFDIRIGASA